MPLTSPFSCQCNKGGVSDETPRYNITRRTGAGASGMPAAFKVCYEFTMSHTRLPPINEQASEIATYARRSEIRLGNTWRDNELDRAYYSLADQKNFVRLREAHTLSSEFPVIHIQLLFLDLLFRRGNISDGNMFVSTQCHARPCQHIEYNDQRKGQRG